MDLLISTDWLAREMAAGDIRILDASYFPLDPARHPRGDFFAGHIPQAQFLDLASLADPASELPSMLPPDDLFVARMRALGVERDSRVILYDDSPHHTAARAWWMLRLFGLRQVAILDGGLARWRAEGRPIAAGEERRAPSQFAAVRDEASLRGLDRMRDNLVSGVEQVVDARGPARFTGAEADPRGLADGHIPASRNLPYTKLFAADGSWLRGPALAAAFAAAGVDLARPLVTTCGSGITAAVVLFGAHLLGKTDVALYDGSWSEWGALGDTPKATGAA